MHDVKSLLATQFWNGGKIEDEQKVCALITERNAVHFSLLHAIYTKLNRFLTYSKNKPGTHTIYSIDHLITILILTLINLIETTTMNQFKPHQMTSNLNVPSFVCFQFFKSFWKWMTCFMKQVNWNSKTGFSNWDFQLIYACGVCLVNCSLRKYQRKKSQGVKSGLLAGHSWGPALPIHLSCKFSCNQFRTTVL